MTPGNDETRGGYYDLLARYLVRRRWFAGKGRDFTVTHVHALPDLPGSAADLAEMRIRIEIVTVTFSDGTTDAYQFPVAYLPDPDPSLEHALVGQVDDADLGRVHVYDAVHVKAATAALFAGFAAHRKGVDLDYHTMDGAALPDPGQGGTVMSAEQSNTSIVFGDSSIFKLFRRVSAGVNPDIEIHEALTRAGSEHVAPLLGWLRGRWTGPDNARHEGDLGMLQVFLRTATDGWDLALTSVRDLFVEGDLHPAEVGADFAGESERLGAAVATVHRELAAAFPHAIGSSEYGAGLATAMRGRLDAAVAAVPELADVRDALDRRFDLLADLVDPVRLQRVHGDLHLGQTLRTVKGWKIIDFEGEPAKTLMERTDLSSPLRDVAGMLRSYDYAAGATLEEFGTSAQLVYRAHEWSARNRNAFLAGYAGVAGDEMLAQVPVLRAFEADKAVYEAVYEARNRPTWLAIPLRALARIAAEE